MSPVFQLKRPCVKLQIKSNELTRTFADTYRLVSVSDSIPPSPVSHDHQLASVKNRPDVSAVIASRLTGEVEPAFGD